MQVLSYKWGSSCSRKSETELATLSNSILTSLLQQYLAIARTFTFKRLAQSTLFDYSNLAEEHCNIKMSNIFKISYS